MTETSIPISATALGRLQELASWAGVPISVALEHAIRDQYDRKFWEAVNAGYAALRADAPAWAEIEAERKAWDVTLLDGLDPSERWTNEARVAPPAEHGRAS